MALSAWYRSDYWLDRRCISERLADSQVRIPQCPVSIARGNDRIHLPGVLRRQFGNDTCRSHFLRCIVGCLSDGSPRLRFGSMVSLMTRFALRSHLLTRHSSLRLRGYLIVYVNLCWAIGQLIAAGVLRGFADDTTHWAYRIPFESSGRGPSHSSRSRGLHRSLPGGLSARAESRQRLLAFNDCPRLVPLHHQSRLSP